ncbi:hypothetical protein ACQZ4X_25760 [Agrobacterium vitis]
MDVPRIYQYKFILNSMLIIDKYKTYKTSEKFRNLNINIFNYKYVFNFSPFSETFYDISNLLLGGNQLGVDKEWDFYYILENYLILRSNEDSPFSKDGYLTYEIHNGKFYLRCDRTDKICDLMKNEVLLLNSKPASREDFIKEIGVDVEQQWVDVAFMRGKTAKFE